MDAVRRPLVMNTTILGLHMHSLCYHTCSGCRRLLSGALETDHRRGDARSEGRCCASFGRRVLGNFVHWCWIQVSLGFFRTFQVFRPRHDTFDNIAASASHSRQQFKIWATLCQTGACHRLHGFSGPCNRRCHLFFERYEF